MTRRQVRTLLGRGTWVRVARGVLDTGRRPPGHPLDVARVRAAWLGLLSGGKDAIAVGPSALALHHVLGLPRTITPEIVLPAGRHAVTSRTRVRRFRWTFPVVRINGYQVAAVLPALVQALPELTQDEIVAVTDSALHQRLIEPGSLEELDRRLIRRRGGALPRRLLPFTDSRAESPLESIARERFRQAGCPPDDLQVELHDDRGRRIARADMGWRRSDGSWVLVEIDGEEVHGEAEALFRDRDRQNSVLLSGTHLLLRFTARDLYAGRAVATLRRALAAERRTPA